MDNSYINYSIEDFACDEVFINWVLNGKNDAAWQEWCNHNPGKLSDVHEAKKLVVSLQESNIHTLSEDKKSSTWQNITQRIGNEKSPNIRRIIIGAAAVAACITLVMMVMPFNKVEDTSAKGELVANNSGETSEYVLPDNSYTYLDSKSSIIFDKNNFNSNRVLSLKGQAFFDVEKGESFVVKTLNGEVQVLGTTFNVIEEENNLVVTCYTGKVAVNYKGKSVILLPNEKSDFNLAGYKETLDLNDDMPLWVGGLVKFENAELKDVITEIKNIYKVEVDIDDNILQGQKYTGAIVKNNIEKAMKSVTWPLHLTYSLEGNLITIEKKEK
jgi:transmembrane sensor